LKKPLAILIVFLILASGTILVLKAKPDQNQSRPGFILRMFPGFTSSPIEKSHFSNREKIRLNLEKQDIRVAAEFFYKISATELQNLIKQNDLQIFNLFVKQPTPYPGVLTQQAGRDCPEDFVPQVENQEDDVSSYHRIDYLLQTDSNLGACSKDEVHYFSRHVYQYCKQEEILMEFSYKISAMNVDKDQYFASKLPCPTISELNDLR
jgi:hypothetical protein